MRTKGELCGGISGRGKVEDTGVKRFEVYYISI
jgi:hypothetical protein